VKYKENWKDPGFLNGYFAPFDVLKPKVLSTWEQIRVTMPERSYEKYTVNKAFKLPSKRDNYINRIESDLLSEQFKEHLSIHNQKFNHFIDRPSHYERKEKFLPQLLDYKKPFNVKKSDFQLFNQPKHNTFIYESKFRMKNSIK
jgi:hypothetical protein